MSGPPPTPNVIKLRRGNPGKRKIRPEISPEQPQDVPEPPTFLNAYARDEYWRIAPELHRLGVLTVLDFNIVAAYAEACGTWRTACETLATMRERDPTTGGLLIRSAVGDPRINPLLRVVHEAADSMLKFAGELGCTAIARARLASAGYTPPERGKFDGLLVE